MDKKSSVAKTLLLGGIAVDGASKTPGAIELIKAENDAPIQYPEQVERASVQRGLKTPVINEPPKPKTPKMPQAPKAPQIPKPKNDLIKSAARDDKNGSFKDDRSNSAVIPGVMAGSVAALYLANAYRHGGFEAPNKQLLEGLKDLKVPSKNPWLRSGAQVLKKTHNVIRPTQEAYESFEIAHKLSNGIPLNNPLPKEERKALYDTFMSYKAEANAFSNEREKIFREANNFIANQRLTNPQKKALNDFIEEEYRGILPPKGAPKSEIPFGGIKPGIPVKKVKFKDMDSEIIKGIGMGGGMAASSLLIHALGDQYFKDKDNDELRKLIRESYDVTENRRHGGYKTPEERKRNMDKRNNYNRNRNDGRSYEKRASAEPNFLHRMKEMNEAIQANFGFKMNKIREMKANGVLKEVAIREGMDLVAKPAIDSLVIAGVPAAAIALSGRDIRHDLKPVKDGGSDQVVLDIPIANLSKHAFVGDEVLGHGKGLSRVMGELPPEDVIKKVIPELPPGFEKFDPKKFWADRGRYAARSIPWVLTPTLVGYALGNDLRTYGTGQQNLTPPEPGYARVVIQTPQSTDNSDFSKLAAEADKKKTLNDMFRDSTEWVRKLLGVKKKTEIDDANQRLRSMDMHDRERNVIPQNEMVGMQDDPV